VKETSVNENLSYNLNDLYQERLAALPPRRTAMIPTKISIG
jgi:hypothetical protein